MASPPEHEGWREYESADADFRLRYPETWDVTVAKERTEPVAAWAPTILEKGELHKVTFRQGGGVVWPGQYEIRVLANPDRLDLEAFYSRFDMSDLWNGSAADTVVGGRPAKTWVRWRYDSLVREYLLMSSVGAVHILHDDENGNDPEFAEHEDLYARMTSTFELVPPQDAAEPTSGDALMSQSQQDRRIDYVEFRTTNMSETKKFYSGVFGWKFTDYGPDYTSFSDGRLSGGFSAAPEAAAGGPLVVLYAADLEGIEAKIKEYGGRIARETFEFPGGRRFHFVDPGGNELAVWSDR